MKLKDTFVTYSSGEGHTMVATEGFSGIVRSNSTAAFIIELLKTPTTPQRIVDAMEARFDAPRPVIEKDVAQILEKLRSIGALEENERP